mgnify:CR=1 FL=1
MLRFNDGITIDTSGPLRTMRLSDGWYVVGDGLLMAADDREDAELIVADLTNARQPEIGSQTP